MGFSDPQASKFQDRLLALDPPSEVMEDFDKLLANEFYAGNEGDLEKLLLQACQLSNWTKPWEVGGACLTFRANKIGTSHPEYCHDSGGENSPATEQAYRRGVSHGIHHAMIAMGVDRNFHSALANLADQVTRWRKALLHDRNTVAWGGFVEPDYPCIIRSTLRRSGLSPRVRWTVLQRDNRKCVVCGIGAAHGAVLEVDHILSVADGGSDDLANLRTLCFDCNRGKGSMSDND